MLVNTSNAVASLVLVFVTCVGITSSNANENRPNIVLIMVDDFGYECLGCNGGLSYQTPNIDRLAKNGVRFTECHSQPLCTPTRNQIMTGKYNFRNYENFEYMSPDEITFGHLLKETGYKTCIAGKWQLNGRGWKRDGREDPSRPMDAGFDATCLWQVTSLPPRFKNPGLEVNGKLKSFPEKYGPDVCTDFVCDFIQENKNESFFVYYPMILTHSPFVPTPDSLDWSQKKPRRNKQAYFKEMVEYTDSLVSKIESSLKANGVLENTILIFTGDNGTTRGLETKTKTGMVKGAKGMTTDAGTHVPLVVSWPNSGASGFVCDDLIDFTDVLPTLMDAASKKIPNELKLDGVSFLPQVKGQTGTPRESIYCFYDPVHSKNVNQFRNRFARSKNFKVYRDGTIFDMKKDLLEQSPLKTQNLSQEEQHEVDMLISRMDDYDSQGAAKAAKILRNKVRPGNKISAINTTCPRSGKPIKPDSLAIYKGHIVGFCNTHCRDDFAGNMQDRPEDRQFFELIINASPK